MTDKLLDVVAIGEPMVEFNQAEENGAFAQGFGGDTSNVAIAASRQGARAAYWTRLGDDAFGRALRRLWQVEAVQADEVATDRDAPTGIYFVTHGPDGHEFTYRRAGSAAARMTPADLPTRLVASARFLHVSGISQAISASATDTVFHAVETARAAGTRVSYDPNVRLKLWSRPRARAIIEATIAQADVFLPGFDEMADLFGLDRPEAVLDYALERGVGLVLLKLGAEGAWLAGKDSRIRIPAFKVAAVDATGAGDCCDGSFLARLAAGDAPEAAARYACAAAALTTQGYSAVAPIPRREAVEAFMVSNGDAAHS